MRKMADSEEKNKLHSLENNELLFDYLFSSILYLVSPFLCLSPSHQGRHQNAAGKQFTEQGTPHGAVAVAVHSGNPLRIGRAAGIVEQRVQGRPAAQPTDGRYQYAAGGLFHHAARAGVAPFAAGKNRGAGAGTARGGRPKCRGHPAEPEPAA